MTVRNLFGDLPVRVKHRAAIIEEQSELDRILDDFKKETTGLFLSWNRPVAVKIRDVDNSTILQINSQKLVRPDLQPNLSEHTGSNSLQILLNILTQGGYISFTEWDSWVPVAASTPSISIKGAISTDPVPTKAIQFISLDHNPLSAAGGHNELFDTVNRIFNLSSFGTTEDDVVVDEMEKTRRESDGRYKSDGFTNRQLKGGRKGIDRWPMFYFRISLEDKRLPSNIGSTVFDNETNVQAVTQVLAAVATEWLRAHNYRPQRQRARVHFSKSVAAASDEEVSVDMGSKRPPKSDKNKSERSIPCIEMSSLGNGKRKRSGSSMAGKAPKRAHSDLFATWTRIKSGNSAFFDTAGKCGTEQRSISTDPDSLIAESNQKGLKTAKVGKNLHRYGDGSTHQVAAVDPEISPTVPETQHPDETTHWTDPATHRIFLLNSRTGCVLPHVPKRSKSDTVLPSAITTLAEFNKPIRLQGKRGIGSSNGIRTPWLDEILRTWKNPVFRPTEQRVQKIALDETAGDLADSYHSASLRCCQFDIGKELNEATTSKQSRLSKANLRDAQVIAQLDKKFILVKMANCSSSSEVIPNSQLLVLIDQHAADERVRVESLFAELCTPASSSPKSSRYRSSLGHESSIEISILDNPLRFNISTDEAKLLADQAARFASWGILYDISHHATSRRAIRSESVLSVSALSPVIAERCKADPKLMLNFLRSEIWKHYEKSHVPPITARHTHSQDAAPWVQSLATCPEGLIDLVNSRACRSAVMFNDELSMRECRDLVGRLADCVFPFKCAHWRPSMVPLVDLGKSCDGDPGNAEMFAFGDNGRESKEGRGVMWKKWIEQKRSEGVPG